MSNYERDLTTEGQTKFPGSFTTGYKRDLATAREIVRARREASGTLEKPKTKVAGNS